VTSVTAEDIAASLRHLGLAGKPVCMHSSLRSFGTVVGGANGVIDGFRAEDCTLIVPSFSWQFAVLPPQGLRPARNGWDYAQSLASDAAAAAYGPDTTVIDQDMGAIPAAVIVRSGHVRGDHPLCSFTALGPLAEQAAGQQTWDDVYAPFQWLADNDGAVILAGVSLTSMTLVHHAEQLAGKTLFRRWVLDKDATTVMVPVGGCSNGFEALAPLLAPLSKTTLVGASPWAVYPAAAALTMLAAAIRDRPGVTRCADPGCVRCRDSIAGGPLL
jgi:aminoglycoside N3'-acetyltransferase